MTPLTLLQIAHDAEALDRAAAATVAIPRLGGRGVLMSGGYVVTAAHCVGSETTMVVDDDHRREMVRTAGGREFRLAVVAVEGRHDVALLGPPDDGDGADEYDAFLNDTCPVPLYAGDPEYPREFLPVFVYNRNREWVGGEAFVFDRGGPQLQLLTEKAIRGGASGGPVVTPAGELAAVMSAVFEKKGRGVKAASFLDPAKLLFPGDGARPSRALPVWAFEAIRAAEKKRRRRRR